MSKSTKVVIIKKSDTPLNWFNDLIGKTIEVSATTADKPLKIDWTNKKQELTV